MNGDRKRDVLLAGALALAATVVFIALGAELHRVAGLDGENDAYDGRAMQMANGLDAGDPYHPYGVPLAIWLGMQCGLDALAAGRAVAALAGGALVGACFLLTRHWFGRGTAALAALVVASSEVVVVQAQLASSDMPAAGLLALALLAWQRAAATAVAPPLARASAAPLVSVGGSEARGARNGASTAWLLVAAGGLALGLAISCRTSSVFVLAAALPLAWAGSWRTRMLRALAGAAGLVLGLLPHLVAKRIWGAGPPHPGNAANLVLKYRLDFDYDRVGTMDAAAIDADLRGNWWPWLQRGIGDVIELFTRDIGRLFVALDAPWLNVFIAVATTLALLAGTFGRNRAARVLGVGALAYGTCLGLTFLALDRLLLPLLPAAVPLLLRSLARARVPAALTTAALLVLTTIALPGALERFRQRQFDRQLAEMQRLAQLADRPLVFLCDGGRTGDVPGCLLLQTFAGWRALPPEQRWPWLRDQVERHHADYVVYSRSRSAELLEAVRTASLPPDWRIERDDDLFVLRPPPPATHGDWQVRFVRDGEQFVLSFRIPPLPGSPNIVRRCIALTEPNGTSHLLDCAQSPEGACEVRLPVAGVAAGKWQLTPVVAAEPGGLLRGPTSAHDVAK